MPQVSALKHALIAQHRFIENLGWAKIATLVDGATADGARKLCKHLETKHPHASPKDLVEIAGKKKLRGNNQRIAPGSNESMAIRKAVRRQYKRQPQREAANLVLKKMRNKTMREPLKELGNQ